MKKSLLTVLVLSLATLLVAGCINTNVVEEPVDLETEDVFVDLEIEEDLIEEIEEDVVEEIEEDVVEDIEIE
ncbi:MAG: hypothetical protein M0P94_00905 [Candidatus Absconditabacterales bacterium]|nr:hypothetical protein [Candidatus Absconditabacterales bacterium]